MKQTEYKTTLKYSVENSNHPLPPPIGIYKPTSVMILFLPKQSSELLFIQKSDVKGYPWRNQIAFPGGHMDENDLSILDTALRELKEELDISKKNVEVIGSLGHYQTINYRDIEAFLGIWNQQDTIKFDRSEISRVLPIPLSHLIKYHRDQGFHKSQPSISQLTYPTNDKTDDVVIWGVTAKILYHLIEIIKLAENEWL